jgi:hypothetical protein
MRGQHHGKPGICRPARRERILLAPERESDTGNQPVAATNQDDEARRAEIDRALGIDIPDHASAPAEGR